MVNQRIGLLERVEENLGEIEAALLDSYFKDRDKGFASTAGGQSELHEHAVRRTRFMNNTIIPWIRIFSSLENAHVVEFGGGSGSTTAALAYHCESLATFDISPLAVESSIRRCEILGLSNVEHWCGSPDDLLPAALDSHEARADIVLLFATLEHQKLTERLNSIRDGWACLRPGGLMVVGDTPNRLAYTQTHTSRMPFFDMLPHGLQMVFAAQSKNTRFAEAVRASFEVSSNRARDLIDRWGRGVSFHEFEAVLGDLRPLTVGHGFERPIFRGCPLSFDDEHLIRYFLNAGIDVPLGFARQTLYVILQKPVNSKSPLIPPTMWDRKFEPLGYITS